MPDDMPDDWDDEESQEAPRVKATSADGSPVKYVAAYSVTREFGGPEEGGWWFDRCELVAVRVCRPSEVDAVQEALGLEFPRTRARYSTRGGEDYSVTVGDDYPEESYPKETPHYS